MLLEALTYEDLGEELTDRYVVAMNAIKAGRIDEINEAADSLLELVEIIKTRSE